VVLAGAELEMGTLVVVVVVDTLEAMAA